MKTRYLIVTTIAAIALASPTTSFAGKKKKNPAEAPKANPVMTKYDKNANGILDDTEKEAIRAALGKDPELANYDKNKDGKLDDTELTELAKAPAPAEAPRKKKKKEAAR